MGPQSERRTLNNNSLQVDEISKGPRGDMIWGGGSFTWPHNLPAFPNGMIQKFFPGFGDTLST